MTFKRSAAGLLILSMAITGAACSSTNITTTPTPAATAAATPVQTAESLDAINMKGYIAARIAQEKIGFLFAEAKSKDGKFILNPVAAQDKAKATIFLSAYFDASLADTLTNYYVTDQKSGDAFLTNEVPYFKSDLLASKKEDITFDKADTKDLVKFTTKDGVTYTTKRVKDKFVLAEVK